MGYAGMVVEPPLMGSIADNTSGGSYSYRLSKTALNMAVKNLAHELGSEGFVSVAIHPGWVQTKMGGSMAPGSSAMGAARSLTSAAVDETKSIGPQLPSALSLRPRRRSAR